MHRRIHTARRFGQLLVALLRRIGLWRHFRLPGGNTNKRPARTHQGLVFERMESRLLLSADLMPVSFGLDATGDTQVAADSAEVAPLIDNAGDMAVDMPRIVGLQTLPTAATMSLAAPDSAAAPGSVTTSRYTLLGIGANFMDFDLSYAPLSLDGQEIIFKGNSGIDQVYVGSASGLTFDFTQAGLGVDKLYLSGNWSDYTRSFSGAVVTFTRSVGGSEVIKAISGDNLIFADGTVSVLDALNYAKGTAPEPVPSGEVSTAFPMTNVGEPFSNTIRAVVLDATGETVALPRPGVAMIVKGNSGVDVVYVPDGAQVDGTQLGLGQDKLYLRGNWEDYSGSYTGAVVTLTRSVGSDTESVTFLGGSDNAYDSVIFANGTAKSVDILKFLNGTVQTAPTLSQAEVTPTEPSTYEAPVASEDVYTLNEDATLEVTATGILANDLAGAGLTLTAELVNGPEHGLLTLNSDGSFTYQPDVNFNGVDAFSYLAFDGLAYSAITAVELTVNPVNDGPIAVDDAASTDEDTPISGNLLTGVNGGLDTDVDGDALTISSTGSFLSTLGATVTLLADGSFDYDPRTSASLQGLGAGASTIDSFNYVVSDGKGGTDSATVSISVDGLAEPTKIATILPSLPPDTQLDYYIRFEGVAGSEWLVLDNFSLGLAKPVDHQTGSSTLTAGELSAQDVFIQLGSSATTTALLESLAGGQRLTNVEIEAYLPETGSGTGSVTGARLIDEFKFSDVGLTSLVASGNIGGTGNSATFTFDQFTRSHIDYDSISGKATSTTGTGFDFVGNKTISAATPAADAVNSQGIPPQNQVSDGPLEYYARFDGITGWLELDSLSFGLAAVYSDSLGGGSSLSTSSASSVGLGLGSGNILTSLSDILFNGKNPASIEIEVYRAGSSKQLVDEFVFQNLVIDGLTSSNAVSNQLYFDYATVKHSHLDYDANGKILSTTLAGWDFAANKAVSPATPQAEASATQPLPSVPSDAQLDYYIRFEGIAGSEWLALDNFSLGMVKPVSLEAGGGTLTAGKLSAQDVYFQLGSSATTTALLESLAGGQRLTNVEIEAYIPNSASLSGARLIDELKFSNVGLTSLFAFGGPNSTGNAAAFTFDQFTRSHIEYDSVSGKATSSTGTGFDFVLSKTISAATPEADAVNSQGILPQNQVSEGPLEYYARFDGITGWLELDSLSFGLAADYSGSLGGGTSSGTSSAGSVGLGLGSGNTLTSLSNILFSGKNPASIEIEVYRAGSSKQLVDEFVFQNLVIDGLASGNAVSNQLNFDYATIKHGHLDYDANGKILSTTLAGWDFATNKAVSAATPQAEASATQPLPSVPPDAQLDYYIRFEGVAGSEWLALDNFSMGLAKPVSLQTGSSTLIAGQLSAQDVSIQLGSSATTTALLASLAGGQRLTNVEIEAYLPETGNLSGAHLIDEFKFSDVGLTSLFANGNTGGTGNSATFTFDQFTRSHIDYDSISGKTTSSTGTGFDFVLSKTISAATPEADAVNSQGIPPQNQVSEGPLEYYARFDGISGWLELDSLSFGLTAIYSGSLGGGTSLSSSSATSVGLGLGSGNTLTTLSNILFNGKNPASIEIEVYRAGSSKQLVDEFVFQNLVIDGLASSNAVSNQLNVDYLTIKHGHLDYDANGKILSTTLAGWDFAADKTVSATTPQADVFP